MQIAQIRQCLSHRCHIIQIAAQITASPSILAAARSDASGATMRLSPANEVSCSCPQRLHATTYTPFSSARLRDARSQT